MSSTTPPVLPTHSRRVVIEGLEKSQDADQVDRQVDSDEHPNFSTCSMIMDEDELFSELWKRIEGC